MLSTAVLNLADTPRRRPHRDLMAGTALGGVLAAMLAASPAAAQDECGAATPGGVVTCTAAGAPYPDGITYVGAAGLTVNVEAPEVSGGVRLGGVGALALQAGGTNVSRAAGDALRLSSGDGGSVTATVADVSAAAGSGIVAVADGGVTVTAGVVSASEEGVHTEAGGDISLTLEAVNTTGAHGGVVAQSGGNVTLDVGSVTTTGPGDAEIGGPRGIQIEADGDISITAGQVSTDGNFGTGVQVASYGGTVRIEVDSLTTRGNFAAGVDAHSEQGDIVVDAGSVTTEGDMADAIAVSSGAGVRIRADAVSTTGVNSQGVVARGNDDITIDVGSVVTRGNSSTAITASTNGGRIDIDFGSVATHGNNTSGIWAASTDGVPLTISGGSVTTAGTDAIGIRVDRLVPFAPGDGVSDVTIEIGSVVTTGVRDADAISVTSGGDVNLTVDLVETSGRDSTGISVEAVGDVSIDAGAVRTAGMASSAIFASTAGGAISITAGTVDTSGDFATGIQATSEDGDLVVTAGTVTTTGEAAIGIDLATTGSATVTADSISTTGLEAIGLRFQGAGAGTIDVTVAGPISTTGDNAAAIYISEAAEVDLNLGSVSTAGSQSGAIVVTGETDADRVSITAGDISTTGFDSIAIQARARDTLTLVVGDVSTAQQHSGGIRAGAGGDVSITAGAVTTAGSGADAIQASSERGGVSVTAGDVTTAGSGSTAIDVRAGAGGSVAVAAGDVSALRATGISAVVDGDGGTVSVTAADVSVGGYMSQGVSVGNAGNTTIRLGSVATTGAGGAGVNVQGDGGDATLIAVSGAVSTAGAGAAGILVSDGGDLTVSAGSIATSGSDAAGLLVTQGEGAAGADVTIDIGAITTAGDNAAGILTSGPGAAGAITLKLGSVATAGAAATGLDLTAGDRLDVEVAGSIRTSGADSTGARLTADEIDGRFGDVATTGEASAGLMISYFSSADVVVGDVVTAGDLSTGVGIAGAGDVSFTYGSIMTGGAAADGLNLESADGSIDVTGGTVVNGERIGGDVTTAGDDAHGAYLAAASDITARMSDISTSGANAAGLIAESRGGQGEIDLAISSVSTSGADADGLVLTAGGDIGLAINRISASGEGSNGVVAEGANVTLAVAEGIDAAGVGAALRGAEAVSVAIAAGATVNGGETGLDLHSAGGSLVNNAGVISSDDGFAIAVSGAAATVINSGDIVGRIKLSDNADLVTNSGAFRLRGTSDFGAGVDVFDNTGLVALTDSAAPVAAALSNLERFNNGGMIDLANGVAGDVLTIDGVFNSLATGRVALDLDLRAAPGVDRLEVGSLEGVTRVDLHVQGAGAIGDTGLVFLDSGANQTLDQVEVETVDGGFVAYDVVYDPASTSYRLVGEAADPAWEPTKVASGGQTQWRRSADVVSARFDDLRDSAAMGAGRGARAQMWSQVFTGAETVNGQKRFTGAGAEVIDLTHDVDTRGIQFGGDLSVGAGPGRLVVGLTGSASETELAFQSNGDTSTFSGLGAGAYAQWTAGGLSLAGLVKMDRYDLDYRWGSADVLETAEGETLGARIEAAWRIKAGDGWSIEPQASLSWTETELGDLESDSGTVEFGDTVSRVARAGVRVARTLRLANGGVVQPFLGLHRLREFDGRNASIIHFANDTLEVTDEALGDWGQVTLGANVGVGPIQGFVQGEAAYGDVEGYTARVGLRVNW